MRRYGTAVFVAPLMAAALLAGCGGQESAPAPQEQAGAGNAVAEPAARPGTLAVADAWVRLAPVAGRPAAGYFTVRGGGAPERLVSISSARVATIELHESGMNDGMMTMRRIDGVDVPAGGEAAFAPGGNHAMLFGVDPGVKPGDLLLLDLTFASGEKLAVEAKTFATGDAPVAAPKSGVQGAEHGGEHSGH